MKFIESDTSIADSTLTVWKRCQKQLQDFFNFKRPLDSVSLSDAKDFREYLLKEGNRKSKGGLSENSTRKMCSIARQIFQDAVDREIIDKNPFSHKSIPTNVRPNRSRDFFVDEKTAQAVLESCP